MKVGLLCLYAPQATKFLVPLLLPLGDQVGVGVAVLEEPIVELFADGLALVVQVVDVPRAGVGYLEDGPGRLVLLLSFVGGVLCVAHLVGVLEEGVFDVLETRGRGFARIA